MGFYEIAKNLLDLAKALFGLKSELQKATLERRIRIADYLDKIGACLGEVASGFRSGKVPAEACGRLTEYMRSLMEVVGNTIDPSKVAYFDKVLDEAALTRGILVHTTDPSVREQGLEKLESAAGEFKALADRLRV
jgi:hypothetical protein